VEFFESSIAIQKKSDKLRKQIKKKNLVLLWRQSGSNEGIQRQHLNGCNGDWINATIRSQCAHIFGGRSVATWSIGFATIHSTTTNRRGQQCSNKFCVRTPTISLISTLIRLSKCSVQFGIATILFEMAQSSGMWKKIIVRKPRKHKKNSDSQWFLFFEGVF
jgi:hypothetical protein